MTERYIHISRQIYEEPHIINLVFTASNGLSAGQLEIYDSPNILHELAAFLKDFPVQDRKRFVWELGSENPTDNFAYYFNCTFSIRELSSECLIHIRLNNLQKDHTKAITEFTISCPPAELNKLGNLFEEFSKLEKESLNWTGLEGKVY